jgi:hypothetical protein
LAIRLLFFTGMALGDDVFYGTQAVALAEGRWPPEPLHWHTRMGLVVPTAVFVKCFGLHPGAFVLLPLAASTLSVGICFLVAKSLVDRRTAWLAAILYAAFPLEVIYSTHLFPDVVVGLFSTLSVWYWIRALRRDQARDYFWSGTFFALGYLCRETIILQGPIYLALWGLAGRLRRPRLAWVFLMPLAVLFLEGAVYAATTGSALYRWHAMQAQHRNPEALEVMAAPMSGGNYWTDPLLMLVFRQEFGIYYVCMLACLPFVVVKSRVSYPIVVWFLVGFIWLYYGTTEPTRWVTLQRDPRYAAPLTVPAVIILALGLSLLRPWLCWLILVLVTVSGVCASALDQGSTILAPHRDLLQSDYAEEVALEPFEYYGARWAYGMSRPPPFLCAEDQGRESVVRLVGALPGTRLCSATESHYFVLSPERRPDLLRKMEAEGWTVAQFLPGKPTTSRALAGRVLERIPSQRERANRIAHPPGLVILVNPNWPRSAGARSPDQKVQ